MTDALCESTRASARRRATDAYLEAVLACLEAETVSEPMIDAAGQALCALCRSRGTVFGIGEAFFVAAVLNALRDGDEAAWATFLHAFGFDDPRRLNRFRVLSPFKECSFIVIERDANGANPHVYGETADFFAALRDDTLVETKRFPLQAAAGREKTFLALRPLLPR